MKGYKAFDENLKCKNVQFKVGEITSASGKLEICNNGLHFCEQLRSVYNYYPKNYNTRICEVEALTEVQTKEDKSCTLSLKIIRELSKEEIKSLTDDLKFNSGHYNSGRYNSGHSNSGYYNSVKSKIKMFNKETDLFHDSEIIVKFNNIVDKYWKPHLTYVLSKDMSELEKTKNPSHITTGGFLRMDSDYSYKKSWEKVWAKCTKEERDFIMSLPNFDAAIFLEITGIDVKVTSCVGKIVEIDGKKYKLTEV